MTINAKLTQPLTGAAEVCAGLGDTGSDCNFVNDHWAKAHGFLPLTTCDQEFITFYGNKFKATNAYDIETFVTDDRGETRPFKLRFYGCQNAAQYRLVFGMEFYEATVAQYADYVKKRWAYAPAWPDDIEILTPKEFGEELDRSTELLVQALFVSKGDCDCPRQWASCKCDGFSISASLQKNPDLSETTLTYQMNTLRKGASEVPEYLRQEGSDFSETFDPDKASELPDLGGVEHAIETDGPVPYGPLYNLSEIQLEALRLYLQDAIRKRWIRPSTSPAGAPILFVPKKDGGLRLCVDYRGLNKVTIKNRHPLPLIDETLDRLVGAQVFTKLDLKDAYHRVRIREGHEWKTAFRTRYGHFEYLVMPFGLANAPATFQAYINTALAGLLDRFVVVYLDDILIYSKNIEEHHDHVRQVLTRLRKNNLFCKLSKCEFDVPEVEFLGFIVGIEGVRADPERIRSIVEWPEPESFYNVQAFLGFANFYRRFIHRYSHVTIGLTELLKGMEKGRKSGPFEMTTAARESFKTLKTAFTTTPVLVHFDPSKKIRVETDASKFAIAGTISQQTDAGDGTKKHWHPVAFWSRKLTGAERNYSTHDGELLAIVQAFKNWRHYLEGSRFTIEVITDHNNLRYFMETKYLESRQARWAMYLATYDFEIIYRKGTSNPADGPSRRPDYEDGLANIT
jgi:RNase H-like domain found in reverse transcriptase/Reverse transcriptase (RNA-dependent DNA polymerase)